MKAQHNDTTSQLFGFSYTKAEQERMAYTIQCACKFMQNYGNGRRPAEVVIHASEYDGFNHVASLEEILNRHGKLSKSNRNRAAADGG